MQTWQIMIGFELAAVVISLGAVLRFMYKTDEAAAAETRQTGLIDVDLQHGIKA